MGGDYTWVERFRIGSIHPFLLSRLADVPPAQRAATRVLDMPAGAGAATFPLRAAGFDVVACDLYPDRIRERADRWRDRPMAGTWRKAVGGHCSESLRRRLFGDASPTVPADVRSVRADLGRGFPFADGTFDFALFVEGIEHLENRHRALREMRRVLRPGGTLLVTTPNLLNLRSRLAYALTGQRTMQTWLDEHSGVKHPDDERRIYHGHAFLVDYFELRYSLHHCGFRVRRLLPARQSVSSALLAPFLLPFVAALTWRSKHLGRRRFERVRRHGNGEPPRPPHDEILRHVLSPALLLNREIVVEAEAV